MNTLVSMTVKNLWGCIPQPPVRLKLHPYLSDVLFAIMHQFRRTIGLVDGRYGLNRSGPMRGEVMELNWLLMGDDLYATDRTCCRLMQIDPNCVRHLGHGMENNIRFNQDWTRFVKIPFRLERAWTDYPGLWAFHSPALTYLAYFSPLAGALHRVLYLFRKPFYDYGNPEKTGWDYE
jgi:uncharacterized protein (DUF362 family)